MLTPSGASWTDESPVVGIFDSGVGGLTIAEAVAERLPGVSLAYVADNRNFPYGLLTDEEVVAKTLAAASQLAASAPLVALVIACNTASTVALSALREALSPLPIVGVVPAIKPAAAASRSGTIGLLATPGTVRRPYVDALLREHGHGVRLLRLGSSELVRLAEAKLRGEPIDRAVVAAELRPLFAESPSGAARLDTVVLGCTHFPLLRAELAAVAPWPVAWRDSGAAVATRTAHVLGYHGDGSAGEKSLRRSVFLTDPNAPLAPALFGAFARRGYRAAALEPAARIS